MQLPASDLSKFIAQHDLTYERPSLEWLTGIPLANGDLGAMLWGDGAPLHFTLDKYDVWETRWVENTHPQWKFKAFRAICDASGFGGGVRGSA